MSVWSGLTQLKQTIADEFQQSSGLKKPINDAISTIERNAAFLKSEPSNVDELVAKFEKEESSSASASEAFNKPEQTNDYMNANGFKQTNGIEQVRFNDTMATNTTKNQEVNETSEPKHKTCEKENANDEDTVNKTQLHGKTTSPELKHPAESSTSELNNLDNRTSETPVNQSLNPKNNEPGIDSTVHNVKRLADSTRSDSIPVQSPASKTSIDEAKKDDVVSVDETKATNDESASKSMAPSLESLRGPVPKPGVAPPLDSSPELSAKLSKFEKYETLYPRLLKAYKEQKRRVDLIALYEKVLAEHTPCTSISEPQKLIDYIQGLDAQVSTQKTEILRLSAEVNSQKLIIEDNRNELAQGRREIAKLNTELSNVQNVLSQTQKSHKEALENAKLDSELKSRVDLLESKLAVAVQAKEAAVKSLTTTKSQLDELHIRQKETFSETEILRNELRESERLSQQRLEEFSALKIQLCNKTQDEQKSSNKSEQQLSLVLAEKEFLESEVELLNKRLLRESEQLQHQLKHLKERLRESESREEDLRKQLITESSRVEEVLEAQKFERVRNVEQSHLGSQVVTNNKSTDDLQLREAKTAAENAIKANALLKQVNDDNSLRIVKLQNAQRTLTADLEQLRHENSILQKRNNKVMSPLRATQSGPDEIEKQQAYLKNVLMGFFQHKDQRKALLPVLRTLLDLNDEETAQFMKVLI